MSALREAHDRLEAAVKAGFPPRTIVFLMAECVLATAQDQMQRGDRLSVLAGEVQDKLGKIVEEMEKLHR
jgi:hypothetical protein